jgi:hypothetical protein
MAADEKKRPQYNFNISMSGKNGEVSSSASLAFSGPQPEVFDEAVTQIERWKQQAVEAEKA